MWIDNGPRAPGVTLMLNPRTHTSYCEPPTKSVPPTHDLDFSRYLRPSAEPERRTRGANLDTCAHVPSGSRPQAIAPHQGKPPRHGTASFRRQRRYRYSLPGFRSPRAPRTANIAVAARAERRYVIITEYVPR